MNIFTVVSYSPHDFTNSKSWNPNFIISNCYLQLYLMLLLSWEKRFDWFQYSWKFGFWDLEFVTFMWWTAQSNMIMPFQTVILSLKLLHYGEWRLWYTFGFGRGFCKTGFTSFTSFTNKVSSFSNSRRDFKKYRRSPSNRDQWQVSTVRAPS